MLATLRQRLILTHVLPLLVIIPVMGITLIYVLETRLLISMLANELSGDALLVSEFARDQPSLWDSQVQAEIFANRISQLLNGRVMLIDSQGRLLASSESTDANRVGELIDPPLVTDALQGQLVERTAYSSHLQTEIVDIWSPVSGPNQQVQGVIRISYPLLTIQQQFWRLRYLILGVLAAGLILGTTVGLLLALNMERPLQRVTQAISQLAGGELATSLSEEGPEEIRLLSRAVNTLVTRLHDLEISRRRLLANLVHELGRPLGALHSAIQALRKGAVEDPLLCQDLLIGMDDEVRGLQHLLDDLAQLHDQVLGTLELERQPLAMSDWLSHMLAPWREAASSKELHWKTSIRDDLPTLNVDSDRLARALGNLVSNAIKYTPLGGTVSVESGADNEALYIRVSDTGPGIPEEERARIFAPFYRGTQAGRFPQGMGLGLSIARDMIIAHGGWLEVESRLGHGSSFTIWLPLKTAST